MTEITVTATLTLTYDTSEGLATTPGEAIDDVRQAIDSGQFAADSFEYTTTTTKD